MSSIEEWAKRNAVVLTTIEPGKGFKDLEPLKGIIGDARVVALGESNHGVHEFLTFRNRLFEFLVEEMGFTAIAVESGYSESVDVDDYVLGISDDSTNVASKVFSWDESETLSENQQLVDWMRAYNAHTSSMRKIHFYGIDLTGGYDGAIVNSRRALDAALSYLGRVYATQTTEIRQKMERFLKYFNQQDYHKLSAEERDILTASTTDLISIFEYHRVHLLEKSSELEYHRALHHAVVAGQLDGFFRVAIPIDRTDGATLNETGVIMARDASMADNVQWALNQEGPNGRVLLFAHNGHVGRFRDIESAYPETNPDMIASKMGEHLNALLKEDMITFGFTYNHRLKEEAPADSTSIDGVLASLNLPLFVLRLNSVDESTSFYQWLNQGRKMRSNDRYGKVNLIRTYDALVYVERTSRIKLIDNGE